MKNLLVILIGWNVFATVLAQTCPCNTNTVSTTQSLVCASNGKTYWNAQLVTCLNRCNAANLLILYTGSCSNSTTTTTTGCPCNTNTVPATQALVCASDGKTYWNAQLVACLNRCNYANLVVLRTGSCSSSTTTTTTGCPCNTNTVPATQALVCASDGKTYWNAQLVACLNRCNYANLVVLRTGSCSSSTTTTTTGCPCNTNTVPATQSLVCASDGKTYWNAQLVACLNRCNAANLSILRTGSCSSTTTTTTTTSTGCPCNTNTVPATQSPVCASDGKTYQNAQLVACLNRCNFANLAVLRSGACSSTAATTTTTTTTSTGCPCNTNTVPATQSPVCASDGKTYQNAQLVACLNRCNFANLVVLRSGACSSTAATTTTTTTTSTGCPCNTNTVPTTQAPVCASNGNTYQNAQLVACLNRCNFANLVIVRSGACTVTTPTNTFQTLRTICNCPTTPYSPVCGSNGQTYPNAANLVCNNRCRNTNHRIIRQGICPSNLCICTNSNYFSPVCGSDGRTYRNAKIVRCLNVCKRRNISILKYSAC